ncbi:hypothetical protein WG936_08230 [Corynebacterium sp. H127]|uniref:Gp37-like protein n=1 Tax=Corynebacterium sp. H127 TaxID=3133418 RepID=UPI0030AACD97
MATWDDYKRHRDKVVETNGQWVGLLDKNYLPIMDIEDWINAEWPNIFGDTGSMTMALDGEIAPGVPNPVVDELVFAHLRKLDKPQALDEMFHEAVHGVLERPGIKRQTYRLFELTPEGGRDYPAKMGLSGVDTIEHLKHLPCWANPSNRSKVVQLQFSDIQQGSAELVSRKIIGRNLIGYQQPSLLRSSRDMTDDYSTSSAWSSFIPDLHRVICSPIPSGNPSEWCVIEARWDNAWDLMEGTWKAAGLQPITWLWLPGDEQPFPSHTVLSLPTVIVDFAPRSAVSGAAGLFSQGWVNLTRKISSDDNLTSVISLDDYPLTNSDGQKPWVVFDLPEAPKTVIRKSTDSKFLVGGQSPKAVNDLIQAGIKGAFAGLLSLIPGIGPLGSALVTGVGELVSKLAADRFLNLEEGEDLNRAAHYGRSGYISLSKPGQANTNDSKQKMWAAKTQSEGGLTVQFVVDDMYPYVAGRDVRIGDVVGVRMWGVVWAAYVSELTPFSDPSSPCGWKVALGNLDALADLSRLYELNTGTVRAIIGRLATYVSS